MKPRWLPPLLLAALQGVIWACSRDAKEERRPVLGQAGAVEEALGPALFADITDRAGVNFVYRTFDRIL
jgi:hypothetical protein